MKLILSCLLAFAVATTSLPLKAGKLTYKQQIEYAKNLIDLEQWQRLEVLISGPTEWVDGTNLDMSEAVFLSLKSLPFKDIQPIIEKIPEDCKTLKTVLGCIAKL